MELNRIEKSYEKALKYRTRHLAFLYYLYNKSPKHIPNLGMLFKDVCPKMDSRYILDDSGLLYKLLEGSINYDETLTNIYKYYPNVIRYNPDSDLNFLLHDNWAYDIDECELYIYTEVIPKAFLDCVSVHTSKATIGYITSFGQSGARISKRGIKQVINSEILENYNEDFPNDDIVKFLKSDESGLIVLRGLPGTGKTTAIRSWVNLIRNKTFVTMDVSDFSALISNKQCLSDLENKILILEDCEDLLKDRNRSSFAYGLSTLLNITDGLYGDFLNLKIICTFNADLNNVDKALLRKGRIKISYEFNALSKDRADKLREKLGKVDNGSNILCDIFNEDSVGVANQVKTTKLGF